MMCKIIDVIKDFYNTYFKNHCPSCDGVMDLDHWNERGDTVYKCRDCGMEWI